MVTLNWKTSDHKSIGLSHRVIPWWSAISYTKVHALCWVHCVQSNLEWSSVHCVQSNLEWSSTPMFWNGNHRSDRTPMSWSGIWCFNHNATVSQRM